MVVEREEIQIGEEPDGASALVMEKQLIAADVVLISQCAECSKLQNKYKVLKKDYMKMGTNYAELRIKYEDLLSTKTYINANSSDITDTAVSDGIFTGSEIAVLKSMSLDQKTDSTFILKCLQYAYKQDLAVLLKKTLKGKTEAMIISDDGEVEYKPGKDPLSPQKVQKIRQLFVERINKCNLKPAENADRMVDAYMNKLIASGITNIGKKTSKDCQ